MGRARGGGYRLVVDVLSNSRRRREMLQEALSELEDHRQRYGQLHELAQVYAAVREVKRQIR